MKRILLALVSVIALVGIGISVPMLTASADSPRDECVPQDARTETTGWVLESPGPGWYLVDSTTVVDQVGTEGHFEGIHLIVWTGGPVEGAPAPGDAGWNQTAGDPQGGPHSGHEVGVPYFVSHGSSGKGDWFMKGGTFVEGTDAVTHDEFMFAFDHPAVVCEEEPPPTTPATNPPKDNPPKDKPPKDKPPKDKPPKTNPSAPEIVTKCQPSKCSTTETLPDGSRTTTVKEYPKAQQEEGF